jgi:hypothetical protein
MRCNLKRQSVDVGSNIVSFGALGVSRPRRPIRYDEPRGKVLLFTGVRYDYADCNSGLRLDYVVADGIKESPDTSKKSKSTTSRAASARRVPAIEQLLEI